MAQINFRYLHSVHNKKTGKTYHYFRRGHSRITLPGEPLSDEFMAAYNTAALGAGTRRTPVPIDADDRTVSALIRLYFDSAEFANLKPVTQANYRNILDRFRKKYGKLSALTIQAKHLNAIFMKMVRTPVAAANLRLRLSRVFRLAVKLGWRASNPVQHSEAERPRSTGFVPWTEEDIQQFKTRWPVGTKEWLALSLLLHTGVRRSDVIKLGWQHISDGRVSVIQKKGGKRVTVPLHPELETVLRGQTGLTFLRTEYGRSFTEAGFTKWFVSKAKLAGLANRTPHGLRKAAGRRLAECGCTEHEIAAMLGQDSLRQVEVYTRDANRVRLADRAGERLLKSQSNPRR
ncbi:Tyrosine recombinase XerC [Brevundimonas sp. NIBR10]|uniref:tyrosine-type recombinase/integrase n=1 Tax=Brevundimonas sp. NIBR10 TaxID=3015997 RepID=UPI0022F145E4|nr:tyrosine-type recombinase/integrase [Brevundimonas sp. NIBR10]WGM46810.1 Tyrosine recombinase XerC [Brevundimonas sp. NIBR10]